MKRREWLRGAITTPAAAIALSASQTATAQTPPPVNQDTPKLAMATADSVADGTKKFFTPAEFETLETLAKAIMPSFNERPGAVEADVPRFLDFLLSQSPPARQTLYRTGLALLAENKKNLAALEQPWTFTSPADPLAQFLRAAKDDIVQATVNSREWAASSRSRTGAGTSYYYFPIE